MEVEATIIEALPNLLYKVSFPKEGAKADEPSREVICYMSGKMRINKIRIMVGDRVRVVLDPHGGKTTNRIIRRL